MNRTPEADKHLIKTFRFTKNERRFTHSCPEHLFATIECQ